MAEWENVSFSVPGLEPLGNIQGAIDDVLSAVEPVVNALTIVLRAIALAQNRGDVTATLVRSALESLLGSLDDILAPAAGHVLWIPPIAPFREAPRRPQIPFRRLADIVHGVQMIRGRVDQLEADGGNYGVYRRFVESLFDEGDYSRPQFQANAYVGGAIVVFGASDFPKLLKSLLSIGDLFGDQLQLPVDGFSLPVPQNVKARPIAVPSHDTLSDYSVLSVAAVGVAPDNDPPDFIPAIGEPELPANFGVRVTWDTPKIVTLKLDFGPFLYRIKRYSIFAKPGGKIQAGEDLSQYEVQSFDLPGAGVDPSVAGVTLDAQLVGSYNGAILKDLDPKTSYYIYVGYTVDIIDQRTKEATEIPVSFETLSGHVRVNLQQQAPYRKIVDGVPPDWVGITNPLRLIPAVNDAITQAKAVGDLALANFTDYQNEANALVDQVEATLERILDANDALGSSIGRLESIFDGFDSVGIWATTFSGQGGVPFLISTIGELLLDPATENRPPFDEGDEPVSALVFVAGSDSAGDIDGFINTLNLLLGTDDDSFFVINDIDRVESDERKIPLDEGANPTTEDQADNLNDEDVPLEDLELSGEDPC